VLLDRTRERWLGAVALAPSTPAEKPSPNHILVTGTSDTSQAATKL
jgi:hypothetical protein